VGCPGRFDRYVPKLCQTSEWISRNPTCTECKLFWKYVPLATDILRYERLESDLAHVLESNGFPPVQLEWEGTPKPRPYQTYYKTVTDVLQDCNARAD
jgi:hypothetical protein